MEITRRSLLTGASALALSAGPAWARLHGGVGTGAVLPSIADVTLSSNQFQAGSTAVFGTFQVDISSGIFAGTLVLGGTDAAHFTLTSIGAGQWTIQAASSLTAGTYSITVTATGSYSNSPQTSPPLATFSGTLTATSASPSGTFLTAPTGTLVDHNGDVWGFGTAWTPTSGYAGGFYVTKNGVNQNLNSTAATASWTLGATTIAIPAGLPITPGQQVIDGSLASATLIGYVQSYSATTLTLTAGALAASIGSTDALGIGQNTWAAGLLYLQDLVYLVDPSSQWQGYSDKFSPTPQWNMVATDPRNFSPAVSASGTVDSTASSPTSIPTSPAWSVT